MALLRRWGSAAAAVLRSAPLEATGGLAEGAAPCVLCGGQRAHVLFDEPVPGAGTRQLVQCDACSLVVLQPLPQPAEIPMLYADDYYGVDNAKFGPLTELFVLLFRLARVRALYLMGHRRGEVLDIGCGRGQFMRALERAGFTAWGTELSEASATGARRFFGDRVHVGPLSTCSFAAGQFDAITAWQVFEHLADPRATLAECRRLLRPGGSVIFSVPNIASWQARWAGTEWFHLDLPRHLFHYTPLTLQAMFEAEGFVVERVSHYGMEQNPFGLLQTGLHRLGAPRLGLYALLRGPVAQTPRNRLRRLPGYAAYLAAFPLAAALETVWSTLGSGATFTMLARRIA